MTDWADGYVTDVAYMPGYYPMQSPLHLAVSCLLAGYEADRPDPDSGMVYLELGCGLGFGAMVLAAANPAWRVIGIDFLPAHIASAQRGAAECGLTNVTFIEADLTTLAGSPAASSVPMADVVSLHGVWTWVSPAVQAGIVRLLREKVLPGGMVHVSYNTLPGWQGELGLQRVIREAGRGHAGRSDQQALHGIDIAQKLLAAEARGIAVSPRAVGMLEALPARPPEYLAHEFMNESWMPCFHADVARALSEAKLDWVASAYPTENFPELALTEPQRAIHDATDDVLVRELIKDMCLDRGLRQDVFMRGGRRMDTRLRAAALQSVELMLTVPPGEFVYGFDMTDQRAALDEAFYRPVVAALAAGPKRVGELLALPALGATSRNAAELISVLLKTEQAALISASGSAAGERARSLNSATARRLVAAGWLSGHGAAASRRLGAGLMCTAGELYLLDRLAADRPMDPDANAAELMPEASFADRAEVRDIFARLIERRAPVWRDAGLP